MSTQNAPQRGERLKLLALLAAVGIVAILVRLVVLAEIWRRFPLYHHTYEGFDQHTYDVWAQQIAGGDWLSRQQGVFYFTPLYPYMLALAYLAAGPGNVACGVAMNAALGVGAALCAAGLGRRLFGWRGGLAAGLLMALAGSQIAWESQLLVDPALTVICLAALWLIVELLHAGPSGRRPAAWWWAMPAVALGAAAVGRGSNLLVAAALVICVGAIVLRSDRRRAAAAAGAITLGFCLAVAPCIVRNGIMYGRLAVTTNGPVTMYVGNAPGATGIYALAPHFPPAAHDHTDGPYWRARLAAELRARPLSLVPTMLRKAALFFNSWDQPDNANYHFLRRYVTSLRWLTVGPLALWVMGCIGIALTAKRWRELVPLYAFGASFAASIILVLVAGRYKLPFYGLMAVFGGGGVASWLDSWRERRWRAVLWPLLSVPVLTAALWPRALDPRLAPFCPLRAKEFHNNASALAQAGGLEEALPLFRDGAALFPEHAYFAERLAHVSLQRGRPDEALGWVDEAFSRGTRSPLLLEQRAVALWQMGRYSEAADAARQLQEQWPDSETARQILSTTEQ